MQDEDDVLGCLFYLIAIITLPFSSIAYGYTLSILWKWFIIKIFALPALSIPLAIGLSMTIRFITNQSIDCEPKKEEAWKKAAGLIVIPFVHCALVLFSGWIILKFI